MPTLDATTQAEYLTKLSAQLRAQHVIDALVGTVSVKVYNGSDVEMASGTMVMVAPWATRSDKTVTAGEVSAFTVGTSGTPDADWYLRFEAGTRYVRGSFGLAGSGAEFFWSNPAFQAGQTGTLGTVTMTASGNEAPSWTAEGAVAPTTASFGASGGTAQFTAIDPNVDTVVYALTTTRDGITINPSTGLVTVTSAAAGSSGSIDVQASDGVLTASTSCAVTVASAAPAGTFTGSSTVAILNPERGWWGQINAIWQTPSTFISGINDYVSGGYTPPGATYALLADQCRLFKCYSYLSTTGSLTSTQLGYITQNCAYARANGYKLFPRFLYTNANGVDVSISKIQADLAQLAPYLEANKDVLFLVEAGLIGSYGEWVGGSAAMQTVSFKTAVRDALMLNVPDEIPVAFTQPFNVTESWYPTELTSANAWDGSTQARIGFHSDCFLTGNGDSSFYITGTVDGVAISKTKQQQRDYVAAATNFVPFGGETCNNSAGASVQMRTVADGSVPVTKVYEDVSGTTVYGGILQEGPRYHLSNLHVLYAYQFTDAWRASGAYDTVSRLIGYRFQLDSVSHAATVARGQTLTVSVSLRNLGWARLYSPRRLVATLIGAQTIAGTATAYLRELAPVATSSTTQTISVAIPAGATPGTYTLHLSAPDVYSGTSGIAKHAIRFANADSGAQAWNATTARMATGTSVTVT